MLVFSFLKLLSIFFFLQRKVEEYYIEGGHQVGISDYISFLIFEGICHNTSGSVIQLEV